MNNNKFKILEVLDLAWGGKAIIMQAKDCELHIFFDYVIHKKICINYCHICTIL